MIGTQYQIKTEIRRALVCADSELSAYAASRLLDKDVARTVSMRCREAIEMLDQLISQHDELLAACKLMIARLEGDIAAKAFNAIRQGGMLPSLYAEAKAAIAKVEASQ